MRALLGILVVVVLGLIIASALGLINLSQTKDGKLPEIRAEGGQLPGFDVKTADVKVGSSNTSVEVPKLKTEKETVEVPTLEIDKAK